MENTRNKDFTPIEIIAERIQNEQNIKEEQGEQEQEQESTRDYYENSNSKQSRKKKRNDNTTKRKSKKKRKEHMKSTSSTSLITNIINKIKNSFIEIIVAVILFVVFSNSAVQNTLSSFIPNMLNTDAKNLTLKGSIILGVIFSISFIIAKSFVKK